MDKKVLKYVEALIITLGSIKLSGSLNYGEQIMGALAFEIYPQKIHGCVKINEFFMH